MVAIRTITVFRNCWFPKRRGDFLLVDLAQWCLGKKRGGGVGGRATNLQTPIIISKLKILLVAPYIFYTNSVEYKFKYL